MHLNRCYPPPLDALHSPHPHSQACSLCGIGSVTNQAYSHFPLQYLPRPCRGSTICEVVAQHFHLWASLEVEFPLDHIGPFSLRDLRANVKFVVRQTRTHASCLIYCAWRSYYLCCCFWLFFEAFTMYQDARMHRGPLQSRQRRLWLIRGATVFAPLWVNPQKQASPGADRRWRIMFFVQAQPIIFAAVTL